MVTRLKEECLNWGCLKKKGTGDINKEVRKRQHVIIGHSTFLCQIFADHLLDGRQQERCCYRDKHSLISSPSETRRDRQLRTWLQNNISTRSYESLGRTVGETLASFWTSLLGNWGKVREWGCSGKENRVGSNIWQVFECYKKCKGKDLEEIEIQVFPVAEKWLEE